MNRTTLVIPLLAALCACHSDRHDRSDSTYRGTNTTNSSMSSKDKTAMKRDTSLSSDDTKFIEKATIGGLFEVQSSRIAQMKKVSRETLDFAQKMVDEHGKANRELDRIATEKGFTPPMRVDASHEKKLDELQKLDGEQFEREYRSMQATAHDDAIELFERYSSKIDDADVRTFIASTLPTLREHKQHLMDAPGPK